ncbi:MAG: hypothetical protein ACM3S5_09015 [Rhodospirillales bacterium]
MPAHVPTPASLSITLSNVRSGNFSEIHYKRAVDVMELQNGAVLDARTGTHRFTHEGVLIGTLPTIKISWAPKVFEPEPLPFTLGELLAINNPGVEWQSWAEAQVHLTFEGKSRRYKSNLLLGTKDGQPKFFLYDFVVGASQMAMVFQESLYPDALAAVVAEKAPQLMLPPNAPDSSCFPDPVDPRLCCDLKKLDCFLRPPASAGQ